MHRRGRPERTAARPCPVRGAGSAATVVAVTLTRRPTGVRVAEAFPALAAELEAVLTADHEPDLAEQVHALVIEAWCRCGDDFCQTFETVRRPWPDGAGTLPHDRPNGMLNVDVAQGRVVGVEALFYPPLS